MHTPNRFQPIVLLFLTIISPLVGQVIFVEDFESYPTGSVAGWDQSVGSTIVDEATISLFGSPNKAMHFNGLSQKLMKDVTMQAVGAVTTLAADVVETTEGWGCRPVVWYWDTGWPTRSTPPMPRPESS